jgi:hypothetical protein
MIAEFGMWAARKPQCCLQRMPAGWRTRGVAVESGQGPIVSSPRLQRDARRRHGICAAAGSLATLPVPAKVTGIVTFTGLGFLRSRGCTPSGAGSLAGMLKAQ